MDYTVAIGILGNDSSSSNNAIAKSNRGVLRSRLGDSQGALEDLQSAAALFQQQGQTTFYNKAMDEIKWLPKQGAVPNQSTPTNNSNNGSIEGPI